MSDYTVALAEQPREFLSEADDKTERIVRENLSKLGDDPHPRPGSGRGDKEKITFEGEEAYRLHIGRSYTAIYRIELEGDESRVPVHLILPIDEAHKRYGWG